MHRAIITVALIFLLAHHVHGQRKKDSYPPKLEGATVEAYKRAGNVELNLYIFQPENHQSSDKRPAVVFFFGGGWKSGSPRQFHQHCLYLAERGMVAMTADYRVLNRHGTKAVECVRDAKSAVRWIRQHSARLGIDPDKIVAGGGSAGGHIAACTGTIQGFDADAEDLSISSRPNAMALFNPAVALAQVDGRPPLSPEKIKEMPERMGVTPVKLSPLHHIEQEQPPTIIFHGKADSTVPYWTVEHFAKLSTKEGNRCELKGYEDQGHGFFNYGRDGNVMYKQTVQELDKFFVSLGYLPPRE